MDLTQESLNPARTGGGLRRNLNRLADTTEPVVEWLIKICGWSAIIFVFSIFIFVFREAYPIMGDLDWKVFFTSTRWIPTPNEGNPASYGALGLIVGTFSVTALGMFLAVPFGLGAAVYISEFASFRVKETLKVVIELLAAIPSIVWGFIGLMILGPFLIKTTGADLGVNLLNGGIIIALMSVPMIVSISEDSLRAVPDSYREAALALGASRWQIVYRVLFPAARNGLLAACMLGVGRAIGETMAVLMATGNANNIPGSFLEPVQTMTATIAQELGDSVQGGEHYQVLFVIGVVLFCITAAINVTSDLIVKGIKGKQHG